MSADVDGLCGCLLWSAIGQAVARNRAFGTGAVLRWFMALLAMALLARMALFARVYHFGFFQAALAGMVTAAMMTGEVPRWAGDGRAGRAVTAGAALLVLTLGCRAIAAKSSEIRAGQTQPVGSGRGSLLCL